MYFHRSKTIMKKIIIAAGCVFLCGREQMLQAQPTQAVIQLNQLGFYPNAPKIAVLTQPVTGVKFFVLKEDSKDTVFKGILSRPVLSKNSSLITRIADFSALKKQGKYLISIPGAGNSYGFEIGEAVNKKAAVASLKGFYFQRCSMPLEPAFAGKWNRAAGHPDTAVLIHASVASEMRPAGTVISSPGGWYDAGDYNKYIVNSGITMGTLLSAFEDFSPYFKTLETNIPESGNNMPDILDETLYNLRWMLTMQDPADGGVYNKCTNASFDGMVMPGVTKLPRYVVQKGTAATLDFVAVAAQASRVLKQFNKELPGLADSCLKASVAAWNWAVKNPGVAYDQNSNNKTFLPAVTTGGYGDTYFDDEFFWAACELFCTTKEQQYFLVAEKKNATQFSLPAWSNVEMLGYYSLFRNKKSLPTAASFITAAEKRFVLFAGQLSGGISSSAFRTVMGKATSDFNWGSNSNAANQGIVLINAFLLTHDKHYIDAALSNLDYILGRNATGYCFVTCIGSHSTMHPHHRQSVADGIEEPVPGLLAGGPNPGKEDKCNYAFSEPETTYADQDCSYASNEIAINWNAPLVYLANAIEALQVIVKYAGR